MGAVFGMSVACSPVVGIGGWSPWCFLLVRPHKSSRARGGERCTALWRKHEPDARTGKPERTELLNNIEAHSSRSWAGMTGWSFYKARRINRCLQRLLTPLFHVTDHFPCVEHVLAPSSRTLWRLKCRGLSARRDHAQDGQ